MDCPLTGKPCDHIKKYVVNEIIDGTTKQFNLCENCANNYLTSEGTQTEFLQQSKNKEKEKPKKKPNQLQQLLDLVTKPKEKPPNAVERCPTCRSGIQDMIKAGRLGCPDCYDHFGATATNAIQHGLPKKQKRFVNPKEYLDTLRKQLQMAIQEERYELAATLRDCIAIVKTLHEEYTHLVKEMEVAMNEGDIEKQEAIKLKLIAVVRKCLEQKKDKNDK